jgi:cell division protein FtsQ
MRSLVGKYRWIIGVAVLAAVGGGGWLAWRWVHTSPRFSVGELSVQGNARVTADEITRLARVPRGQNVFAQSMRAIEARVARHPWIASARAQRRLPRTIEISVEERRAAAVVDLGGLYLVDAAGRPFKRAAVDAGEADGLLVITGLDRRLWRDGSDAGAALVRRGLDLVRRWGDARAAIGEVHFARAGATMFTAEGAVAIRLGLSTDDDLAARFARFDATWSSLSPDERAAARAVNLDSATRPDRVTVRLGQAPKETKGSQWPRASETN